MAKYERAFTGDFDAALSRLEQAVLEALRHQIALAVEMDELVAEINRSSTRGHNAKRLLDERAQLEAEREHVEQMKLSLYPVIS